jgi:hypothetical protein
MKKSKVSKPAVPAGSGDPYSTPRAVDHLVLPVCDLATARSRHEMLGFTVAPDARHPFGTENACVFLADGTYLEPLAIGHRETCEKAAVKGNIFVARDQAFRFRNGEDGFSAIALTTSDAKSDKAAFRRIGMSAGQNLSFSRVFDDGKGKSGSASFELAFAADLRAPDAFMFSCLRKEQPPAIASRVRRHANGVVGIASVVGSEQNPSDFQYFLEGVLSQRGASAHSFGLDMEAANSRIEIMNSDGMRAWFGLEEPLSERGLRFRAVIFVAKNLAVLRSHLTSRGISWREHMKRIVVDPAPGQGAIYAFEGEK